MHPNEQVIPDSVNRRRRIGGYVEEVESLVDASEDVSVAEIAPLPGASAVQASKRKRRSRRKWYRRPRYVVALSLFSVLLIVSGTLGYRVHSLLTTVHTVSTPPPVVTDNTYIEEGDPDTPLTPISVDTGPAKDYLDAEVASGELPAVPNTGLTGRFWDAADNSSDLVQGAAAAVGVGGDAPAPITLLLMGVDAQPGTAIDIGVRPDVLAILQLDPVTGSCTGLSVPRDTRVELPGYGESKINHALMIGGIPYQFRVTEEFLNVEIDHYLLIDFVAFQQIVDTLGGVTVDVPETLTKNGQQAFAQGPQFFDGATALRYARFRSEPDGDLGRVERQWGVLDGISDAMNGRDLVGEIRTLLPTLEDHIRTDLSATDITQIAKKYGASCSTMTTSDITLMRGTRVKLHDPILDQIVYFNVVEAKAVDEYTTEFRDEPLPNATPVP